MKSKELFEENNIDEVILEFDYKVDEKIDRQEILNNFKEEISESFPNTEILPQVNNKQESIDIYNNDTEHDWIFRSWKGEKQINLTANRITLIFEEESFNFKIFLKTVKSVISIFNKYESFEINFSNLRYVVKFEDTSEHINLQLSNNPLLNQLENDHDEITQVISRLELNQREYHMILQYGLINPKTNDFILDYSCTNNITIPKDNIINTLSKMHNVLMDKFLYSLQENM